MGGRAGLGRAPPAEEPQREQPPQEQPQEPPQPGRERAGAGRSASSGVGEAMLPWKRAKAEALSGAAGEEAASAASGSRAKAGPVGTAAALGSLSRGCPGEGALSRVGQLLRRGRRRQTFRVSREAPSYSVLYLGNATTLQAKGEGCTDAAVGRIWAKSQAGRLGAKMRLTIAPQGLRLAPPDDRAAPGPDGPAARPGHLYLLHRVTYCVADPRLPRLFAWVYRHEGKHKAVLLRCHAVLASRAHKARAMARLLRQTSAAALDDFRRLKRRADARRQHLQLQLQHPPPPDRDPDRARPLPPLRRLLLLGAPAAAYKPPVERSRSAPRLGSIAEDALGEQLEQDRHPQGPGHDQPRPLDDAPHQHGSADAAPASLGALLSGLAQLAVDKGRLLSGHTNGDGGAPHGPPQPDTG